MIRCPVTSGIEPETMACRAGSTDWPALCHWKLFLISAGKFQCDQRLFNCVRSVLHDLNHGSLQIRRYHTFMRDRVSFGYFCENISAVEIVSHRNGDVGGPFFLFIQRVNGNTAGDKRSPGFCDPLQRAFRFRTKMLFKIPGASVTDTGFPVAMTSSPGAKSGCFLRRPEWWSCLYPVQ